jgi:hypothetical protein
VALDQSWSFRVPLSDMSDTSWPSGEAAHRDPSREARAAPLLVCPSEACPDPEAVTVPLVAHAPTEEPP